MRETPLAYSVWDRAALWICSQPWIAGLLPPGWQARLRRLDRAGHAQSRLARLTAAQQAGVGVSHKQAAPGAERESLLVWCDEAMADAPRTSALDIFEVVLARCSADELRQAAESSTPLGDERILATWVGGRMEWWQAGREEIGRAIPDQHDGLALFLVTLSAIYSQVGNSSGTR